MLPTIAEEHTAAADLIFTLSMESQGQISPSIPRTREAKGKGKAITGLHSASSPNLARLGKVEAASEAGNDQLKQLGSAAKMNVKPRPRPQRARSGDHVRRTHSAQVLTRSRVRKVVINKRQGTEQSTQEAASTGTAVDSQSTSWSATEDG